MLFLVNANELIIQPSALPSINVTINNTFHIFLLTQHNRYLNCALTSPPWLHSFRFKRIHPRIKKKKKKKEAEEKKQKFQPHNLTTITHTTLVPRKAQFNRHNNIQRTPASLSSRHPLPFRRISSGRRV